MALRFSTGLRNALMGRGAEKSGVTISFDAGTKQIRDSANGLGSFQVGVPFRLEGSTSNDGIYIPTVADSGYLTVGVVITDEAAGDSVLIRQYMSGSLRDILLDGVIRIYSGSQPASADEGETGTLLAEITKSGATFTPGSPANGLDLDQATDGVISKRTVETWTGNGVANGTAGWFRWYDNSRTTGVAASTTRRLDGSCGTSGAQMNMSSTAIASGVPVTIDSAQVTQPAS